MRPNLFVTGPLSREAAAGKLEPRTEINLWTEFCKMYLFVKVCIILKSARPQLTGTLEPKFSKLNLNVFVITLINYISPLYYKSVTMYAHLHTFPCSIYWNCFEQIPNGIFFTQLNDVHFN